MNILTNIGYSKNLYYSFFTLYIKMLYELKNYTSVLKEIRDHYDSV